MDEVATKIVEILKKHMRTPTDTVALDTPVSQLGIESLDLAMIAFDIEDTFGIELPYNANQEVEAFATVGAVVEKVKSTISASRAPAVGGPRMGGGQS